MKTTLLFSTLILLFIGCNSGTKTTGEDATNNPATSNVLPGLWSIDSSGQLTNNGYLFLPDGTLEEAGTGHTGSWKQESNGTLTISTGTETSSFSMSALSETQIKLNDSGKEILLRKVLYGASDSEMVLAGYMGSLNRDVTAKEYQLLYAPATKAGVRLIAADTTLYVNVSVNGKNLNAAPTREWSGIVITGGELKVRVQSATEKAEAGKTSDFEVKMLEF